MVKSQFIMASEEANAVKEIAEHARRQVVVKVMDIANFLINL